MLRKELKHKASDIIKYSWFVHTDQKTGMQMYVDMLIL